MSSKKKEKNKSNSEYKNAYVNDYDDGNNRNNKSNKEAEIRSLPTIEYIEATVQKDVQEGLLELARSKPDNPIEFLGKYLYDKSKKKKKIIIFFCFVSFIFY